MVATMPLTLTDEQVMLRDMARNFARKEIAPKAEHYDRASEFPDDFRDDIHSHFIAGMVVFIAQHQHRNFGIILPPAD